MIVVQIRIYSPLELRKLALKPTQIQKVGSFLLTYHFRIKIEKIICATVKMVKTIDFAVVIDSLSISTVYVTSAKFAVRIIPHEPAMIKMSAGMSYLHIKTSFRNIIDRKT